MHGKNSILKVLSALTGWGRKILRYIDSCVASSILSILHAVYTVLSHNHRITLVEGHRKKGPLGPSGISPGQAGTLRAG